MFWGYDTKDPNKKIENYQTDEEYRKDFCRFCIEMYEDDKEFFKEDEGTVEYIDRQIQILTSGLNK